MASIAAQINSEIKDSLVSCQTGQGNELRATLVRLTRYEAVLELYDPALVLRASEVLRDFRIVLHDRAIYSGRGVTRALINTGAMTLCEVVLEEGSWADVEFSAGDLRNGKLQSQFQNFIQEWQKLYRVTPEYKVIVADMQSFFAEMRLWLDQVELNIRASPSADRLRLEAEATEELARPILPCIDVLFEKFEGVAEGLPAELLSAHRNYMRRQLHPFVLCAPFAYRTFQKPLGYAGDYEMVNMILRNGQEGASLFAKVVNAWFLRQPPAQAHRNRIARLVQVLEEEAVRARSQGRRAEVMSVGCGPAGEVQRFLSDSFVSDSAAFTLLDFNQETLEHARSVLTPLATRHGRPTPIEYVRKSVQQILKESGRTIQGPPRQYDLIYCAGLFDYLSDQICQRLMTIMYNWLAPGGLLIATNVEPSNPLRNGMDHLLDWHLIYRTAAQMGALVPPPASTDAAVVRSENTGLNLFLEVRKPAYV